MTLAAGSRLGPYEILAPLGAGGMGEVYRARDTRLGREVAIKVLPEAFASDRERLSRFEQEARSASALNHPNIVTIYDVGQTGPVSWMAMELVEGQSLRQLLAGGALSPNRLLSIASQIADGLAKAHASSIVHRDLKPDNVMVTAEGLVKILDFGLAKLAPEIPEGSQIATAAQQTGAGVVLGTVGYMSPEQATGRALDYRSDQFTLGTMLYEMATGRHPFQRATAIETLSAILKEDPAPLGTVSPEAPEPLEWIVRRCLAKEPEDRYHSTRDLARDLAGLRDRATGRAVAGPVAGRRRLGSGLAIAAVGIAVLVAVWLWTHRRGPPAAGAAGVRSLAVLPFQNIGGRAEDEYLSDGITESLITDLAKAKDLLVIARNSSFRYRGAAVDVKRVGSDLGVRYVLEGSVQRAGESIRVNAQLIDAATGYHVWAEKYDRSMKDIFALQDDLSRRIGEALQVALVPAAGPAGTPTPTPSLEAYDAYLRGIFYSEQRFTWQQAERGIGYLEQAVALDPGFAQAHAALAIAYARRSFESDPTRDWERKAFLEIEKALTLDPNQAEIYVARASLSWNIQNGFQHEKAAADFRKALAINPNLGSAHSGLGSLYSHVGLFDRALDEYRAALKVDPHDLVSLYRVPRIHLYQQRYAEALAGFDATPEFRKDFQKPLALAHLGRMEEALSLAKAEMTNPTHSKPAERADAASTHAVLLALTGDANGAERSAVASVKDGDGRSHFHHAAYNLATAYAILGRKTDAVKMLEKVAAEGMPCYPLFEKDPFLENLRGDSGFVAFLGRRKAEWERFRTSL